METSAAHYYVKQTTFALILCASAYLHAYDIPYYYHAAYLFEGPHVAHDGLTSIEVAVSGSWTKHARNRCHDTVPIFDIYGTHNMKELGVGVPNKDMSNPLDILLTQLALLPSNDGFASFSIEGKFSAVEANILLTQDFCDGIFLEALIPVKRFKSTPSQFTDLSPLGGNCPNRQTPLWQAFLLSFDEILNRYGLTREPFSKTGIGDITVVLGVTHSYDKSDLVDFVDATIRMGFVAPSAQLRDEHNIFAVPFGSDGHWGIPIVVDMAFGACEWFVVGTHFDAVVFAPRTRETRLQTSPAQSGLIKLATGKVRVRKGSIWRAGGFVRADRFCRGLSVTAGYSFAVQNGDQLCPEDPQCFPPAIINSSEMIKSWKMHTIHLLADYEFSYCEQEDEDGEVKLGIFYNAQVGGERVFKANMVGGLVGISVTWPF